MKVFIFILCLLFYSNISKAEDLRLNLLRPINMGNIVISDNINIKIRYNQQTVAIYNNGYISQDFLASNQYAIIEVTGDPNKEYEIVNNRTSNNYYTINDIYIDTLENKFILDGNGKQKLFIGFDVTLHKGNSGLFNLPLNISL